MPLDGAFLVVAGLVAAAALAAATGMLHDLPQRRPKLEASAFLLVILGIMCCALSSSALRSHVLGQPLRDPSQLLTDMVTMSAIFAVLGLLIVSSQPWPQGKIRLAHRLAAGVACITGMTLCAAGGVGSPEMLAYFTLYFAFLGTALIEILVLSWRQAQLSWHSPFRRTCLLLTSTGAAAGVAALAGQIGWAFSGGPGPAAQTPAVQACASLLVPIQCTFTVALPGASVLLASAGMTLPVLAGATIAAWRFWRHLRMLHALGPLWERLRNTFPETRLPEHGTRGRLDPAFRLYRRAIEIADGRRMLLPYMRPEVSAAAAAAATRFGLDGDDLRATVEAAEIVAAIRARRSMSGVYDPQGYDSPLGHADAEVPDLWAETAWLVKVARAYATSPIVYQLMTHRS
jgi:hypothetical protein